MAVENSFRNYYRAVASMPDVWGSIWKYGIDRDQAAKIAHDSVCALCGRRIAMEFIVDQETNHINPKLVTLTCPTHGNAGTNAWGFVKSQNYTFISPAEVREAEKAAKNRNRISPKEYSDRGARSFSKLGSIGIGDRNEGESISHFRVVFADGGNPMVKKFITTYGKTPDKLNVRFPGRTMNEVFYSSYQCYRQGGLVASAEISKAGYLEWRYFRDPETLEVEISGGVARTRHGFNLMKEPVDTSKPIYTTLNGEDKYIHASAKLQVCISELTEVDGVPNVGFFELNLNSQDEILFLRSAMEANEKILLKQGTNLSGTKFVLSRGSNGNSYDLRLEGTI